MSYDLISDLHIDHWDKNIKCKTVYGKLSNYPFSLPKDHSDILIIAGDISDNINMSLDYINNIANNSTYKKILFVDGNHDHVNNYPNLHSVDYINQKIKELNNNKIVYISKEPFIDNKTVFIGSCGWWDYNNNTTSQFYHSYFKEWMPELTLEDNKKFIKNVLERSQSEFEYIKNWMNIYENDDNIENIIVVTHTVPNKKYCENEYDNYSTSTQINTKLSELFDKTKYTKLKYWLFGHTHQQYEDVNNKIKTVSNPRGRPADFNREIYKIKSLL